MQRGKIYVSELSSSTHKFHHYHFCRGNSNLRKTRIGVIIKGNGAYIYLNKKLNVYEGDLVFIPENIYCYSEWHGSPEIEVLYISCFIHYERFRYEPQIINCGEDVKKDFIEISNLLLLDDMKELEAYSLFYKLLQKILPLMEQSNISCDKSLQQAVEFITEHWDQDFSIGELAKKCCMSESALYHLFQKELGQTPIHFLNAIRINKAIEYLENSNYSVSTISRFVGFHSENYFRKVFTNIAGVTPLKYRKINRHG